MRGLPLAAVGVCAGAGYMAAAVAEEPAFLAFAGIAGFYAEATPESMAASRARIDRGRAAERKWLETGVVETIPAVAPDGGDVGMPLREAYDFHGSGSSAELCKWIRGAIGRIHDVVRRERCLEIHQSADADRAFGKCAVAIARAEIHCRPGRSA